MSHRQWRVFALPQPHELHLQVGIATTGEARWIGDPEFQAWDRGQPIEVALLATLEFLPLVTPIGHLWGADNYTVGTVADAARAAGVVSQRIRQLVLQRRVIGAALVHGRWMIPLPLWVWAGQSGPESALQNTVMVSRTVAAHHDMRGAQP